MPYIIERREFGRPYYRVQSQGLGIREFLGERPYTANPDRAWKFDTRGEAARECIPGEQPVIYVRILRKTY